MAEARHDLHFPHQFGEAADVNVVYCPERVLPGHILHELVYNDRIIGGITPRCAQRAAECGYRDPDAGREAVYDVPVNGHNVGSRAYCIGKEDRRVRAGVPIKRVA